MTLVEEYHKFKEEFTVATKGMSAKDKRQFYRNIMVNSKDHGFLGALKINKGKL